MPPENVFTKRADASARSRRSSNSSARCTRVHTRQALQPADHDEVRVRRHEAVDGRLLRGNTDPAAYEPGLRHDVGARDEGGARGGNGEGGEDADGGGLAGAVVAEEPEDPPGRDVEVEAAQRPEVAEALAEVPGGHAAVRGCVVFPGHSSCSGSSS